jgi:hypothetical protein
MKNLILGAIALMVPASAMAMGPNSEIGYPTGALATDALVKGDNELALKQLMESEAGENDPARLINLGRTYARMGRTADAARAFQAAIDASENFPLILTDGRVMDSREAARLSLMNIQPSMAAR